MNTRQTWWLVGTALALACYILLVDRRIGGNDVTNVSRTLLSDFRRDRVTSIEITETNQPTIRLKKVNQLWELVAPIHYPAQTAATDRWLYLLEQANWVLRLSPKDIASQGASLPEFGLQPPQKTVTLVQGDKQSVLRIGNRLAVGKQLYVQADEQPDVLVTDELLLDALPAGVTAWRDPALLTYSDLILNNIAISNINRLEVRPSTNGYILQTDPVRITRPISARADVTRVSLLLGQILPSWKVEQFVTDDPAADLSQYGLQPPVKELLMGNGTNDIMGVQFGQSPTNRPDLIYARLLLHTNIVLTAKTNLDVLNWPVSIWRDHLLAHIDPHRVQAIVGSAGTTNSTYRVQQQTNGDWQVVEPEILPADRELVTNFFTGMNDINVDVEREVVTDFASYGLAAPAREFSFLTATNGAFTNIYATLSFGTNSAGKAFAHRSDETAVYSIDKDIFYKQLPLAYWQWRDRSIWNFQTNEVKRVRITDNDKTQEIERTPEGQWRIAPGSSGVLDLSFDEAVYQLGHLAADRWVWVGKKDLGGPTFGFATNEVHCVAIEVTQQGVTRTNVVEFGGTSAELRPYATVQFDDDRTWFFEFPPTLYYQYVKHWFHSLENR
ncbi:DUF4340 domain-containing protein [bacterium]|nr:DUF4340 domain-containing protein [bacterium]